MIDKTDAEKVQEVLSERDDDRVLVIHNQSGDRSQDAFMLRDFRIECQIQAVWPLDVSTSDFIKHNLSDSRFAEVLLPFTSSDQVRFYPKDSND